MRVRALAAAVAVGSVLTTMTTTTAATADDFSKPFQGYAPANTVLRDATPEAVGLDPAPIEEAVAQVRGHEEAPAGGHPM